MKDLDRQVDLFQLSQDCFRAFVQEFATYGIHTDPALELRQGTGLLSCYDRDDGHIYVSIPDLQSPEAKLHLLLLRSALSCRSNDELLDLFRLLLPYAIAHELAHHYRHHYGLFSDDLWHEEQVANQLATAVVKHRLAPRDRQRAASLIKRAMDGLAEKLGLQDVAADSYHSIWQALGIGGQIEDTQLRYLELTKQFFGTDTVEMLRSSGGLSDKIRWHLGRRERIIDEINEQYTSDYLRYIYYQLGWIYLDLVSPERQYVEGFARQHLHLAGPMTAVAPAGGEEAPPTERAVLSCFRAYQDALPHSPAGSRYFYKRYRSLLLALLRAMAPVQQFRKEATYIYQTWDGKEGKADMLAFVSHLAPPDLQALFPHQIADHPELHRISPPSHLPTDADRQLWRHICLAEPEAGAGQLLTRLAILEQIPIFGLLPAEVMLELIYNLCRIKLAAGETIIWEHEQNRDVYIVLEGRLGAFHNGNGHEKALDAIRPGEVFGEMAFFTKEPRSATVRALERSECLVLKETDLHILAFKYPVMFVQITRILSKRLAHSNGHA
jgi:CRP/FNR family cyclic AMP-dependent transcriptional regulator